MTYTFQRGETYRVEWVDGSAETAEPLFIYSAVLRAAHVAAGRTSIDLAIRQVGDAGLSLPLVVTIGLN